jgi:hypothetical protein
MALFEYERRMNGQIDGSIKSSTMAIPGITIKVSERNGTAKWRMTDRETKDTGYWTLHHVTMAWKEARESAESGERAEPTVFRRHHTGQLAWAYLIKYPRAVYQKLQSEVSHWGEIIDMEIQK